MNLILGIIIPLVAFLFEIYPRILNRKFGVDIWTHLLYLKEYHRQGGIPQKIGKKQGFLVEGKYDYPPMFIWILSRFPFKWVEKYEFVFSPFFDALHLILVFFISLHVTQSVSLSLVAQLLYMLTPIIILENSSATPRSLGYMLFTLLLMSLFLFQQTGVIVLLGLSVIFGTLIFLSHRFTTQGFLFFAVFFGILDKTLLYIIIFTLSFVMAVLLSRGFYLKVLRGHLGNLYFWYKNIGYRFAHQVRGNEGKTVKTDDFVFKLYNQFLKFPPFVLAITNPWMLPVLYIFFFAMPADYLFRQMVWWVIFSYGLALATIWIPQLRFIGEGQRYLELAAFPAAFLSAKLLFSLLGSSAGIVIVGGYIIVGIAAFITIVVIQKKAIIKDRLRTLTPSMQKMFAYLKRLKKKPKLLCIPHQITTSTIYHTGCPVFVNAGYANEREIEDVYPFIRKPIEKIMEEHKLDLILLDKDYAKITDLKLKRYKLVRQIDNFLLIKSPSLLKSR